MEANRKDEVYHLGSNLKHLMKAFGITQSQLADKLGMTESQLCNLLQKADIDDKTLQRMVEAIGNGVTVDMIKNYDHNDTISYIINNYNQNIENGGTGTFIPNPNQKVEDGGTGTLIPSQNNCTNSTFEEGSQPTINHYVAEQAFAYAEKNTRLEKLLLYYRMKVEPEVVEKEMESLKRDYDPDQV